MFSSKCLKVSLLRRFYITPVSASSSPYSCNVTNQAALGHCHSNNINEFKKSTAGLALRGWLPLVTPQRYFKPRRMTWPIDHLPFKWTRPEKKCGLFNSGDKPGFEDHPLDMSQPKGDFKLSTELETASEEVKKIFSLGYASLSEINQERKQQFIAKVQRHPLDEDSQEVKIAKMTWRIKLLQEHLKNHKNDSRRRILLNNTINKRNKKLKLLSRAHYERFEWLIKELDIDYKIPPPGEIQHRITRKGELRRLTREYCENLKNQKLQAYHEELKKQQKTFLEEKEQFLDSITKKQS